jgi:hypothetical protein
LNAVSDEFLSRRASSASVPAFKTARVVGAADMLPVDEDLRHCRDWRVRIRRALSSIITSVLRISGALVVVRLWPAQ